jgi:hypothetical protein
MSDKINEEWTLYSIIEYVSENFIGLILLVLAFFIIYFVDHINQLNTMVYAPQQTFIPIKPIIPIKTKSKKSKKY